MSEITELLQQEAGLSPGKAQDLEAMIIACILARVMPPFQEFVALVLGVGSGMEDSVKTIESRGLSCFSGWGGPSGDRKRFEN